MLLISHRQELSVKYGKRQKRRQAAKKHKAAIPAARPECTNRIAGIFRNGPPASQRLTQAAALKMQLLARASHPRHSNSNRRVWQTQPQLEIDIS
jgi:hypothetical protein